MSNPPPDPVSPENRSRLHAVAGVPPGLTPEQLMAIQTAEKSWKKLNRAVAAARIDGGITATFAVLCLLSFCMGWENIVLGVAFAIIAANSFRLARRLKKADLAAPASLAMNQIYLGGVIILYALYELYVGLSSKGGLVSSQLAGLGNSADVERIGHLIYGIIYGGLIVGSILAQGGAAYYYITRKKYLTEYVEKTPPWVVDFLAARA